LVADGAMNIGTKEVLDWLFYGDCGGILLLLKHDPNKCNDNNVFTRVGHKHGTCTSQLLISDYHLNFLASLVYLL
jgi:hypothetical protein